MKPSTRCGRVHFERSHRKWLVITVRPTTSVKEKSTKEATAPQHTRFILPPIHPTKSSLHCVGGIFLLWGTYLENFMSRPDVISTFRQRRHTNRGRNFVRSKRRSTYTSSGTLYLFLRLNNSETFVELVGARPLHLLSQTVLPLKSPTGAFIAALRFANAVYAF